MTEEQTQQKATRLEEVEGKIKALREWIALCASYKNDSAVAGLLVPGARSEIFALIEEEDRLKDDLRAAWFEPYADA